MSHGRSHGLQLVLNIGILLIYLIYVYLGFNCSIWFHDVANVEKIISWEQNEEIGSISKYLYKINSSRFIATTSFNTTATC